MKRTTDLSKPTPERQRKQSALQTRSAHVGHLWQWAHDPANKDNPVAESVRVLLGECQRLAGIVVKFEELKVDNKLLSAAIAAFNRASREVCA